MRSTIALTLTLAFGASAAGVALAKAAPPIQFKLSPQNGSGETGTATLLQGEDSIVVRLRLANTGDVDQPAHIHKGTCAKLDPKPAFPLTTVHEGVSETKVKGVTLAQLTSGEYAINVHKSTKDIPAYVSCGDLAKK